MTKRLVSNFEEQQLLEKAGEGTSGPTTTVEGGGDGWVRSVAEVPFSFLSIDIPPCPLFRDSHGGLVIPQIPLFQLLRKFDGHTWTDSVSKDHQVRKQYRIRTLPRYLVLHLARFTRNNFSLEKNATIVTFPVKNLQMRDFLFATDGEGDVSDDKCSAAAAKRAAATQQLIDSCPSADALQYMGKDALLTLIKRIGSEQHQLELRLGVAESESAELERLRLLAACAVERVQLFACTKYDLMANVCHDSTQAAQVVTVGDLNMTAGASSSAANRKKSRTVSTTATSSSNVLSQGAYKVHIHNSATGQWFEVQDLHVAETMPQLVGVSESNILIYEKRFGN